MIFKTTTIAMFTSTVVADQSLRGQRQLTEAAPCGALKGCYLWDKTAKKEVLLTGNDSYCPSDSTRGWSVRCDTVQLEEEAGGFRKLFSDFEWSGEEEQAPVIDEIKFFYDGIVFDEYDEPRWMNGDSDGSPRWINDVAYLKKSGDKEFSIEGRQWERSCFSMEYKLTDSCPIPVADPITTKAPTDAPSKAPTDAPTKSPTEAPTKAPTEAPTKAPTAAPTTAPTEAPTKAPTKVPTEAPTDEPTFTPGTPPEITSCRRNARRLRFWPKVEKGVTLELERPDDGFMYFSSTGRNFIDLNLHDAWEIFNIFHFQGFNLRFVMDGVAGPWTFCPTNTPIGLDLDGSNAVERIQGDFEIDITGDGNMNFLHEWFAPTEGILISMMPFIQDGMVTGQNLFGDMGQTFEDGYEKLGLLDRNDDHVISGSELDGLSIWNDINSNARLDDGELSTLESHGIVGLRTDKDTNYASSAILNDGTEMYMEDLWFAR